MATNGEYSQRLGLETASLSTAKKTYRMQKATKRKHAPACGYTVL